MMYLWIWISTYIGRSLRPVRHVLGPGRAVHRLQVYSSMS